MAIARFYKLNKDGEPTGEMYEAEIGDVGLRFVYLKDVGQIPLPHHLPPGSYSVKRVENSIWHGSETVTASTTLLFDPMNFIPEVRVKRGGIQFPVVPLSPERYPSLQSSVGWCAPTDTIYDKPEDVICAHEECENDTEPGGILCGYHYRTEITKINGKTYYGHCEDDTCECNQRNGENDMSYKDDRARALMNAIVTAQEQLDALSRIPSTDDYADGTVLKVVVRMGEKDYTYVLFKVTDDSDARGHVRWYHSGRVRVASSSKVEGYFSGWSQVVRWLAAVGDIRSVTEMIDKPDESTTSDPEWVGTPFAQAPSVPLTSSAPTFNLGALPTNYTPPTAMQVPSAESARSNPRDPDTTSDITNQPPF